MHTFVDKRRQCDEQSTVCSFGITSSALNRPVAMVTVHIPTAMSDDWHRVSEARVRKVALFSSLILSLLLLSNSFVGVWAPCRSESSRLTVSLLFSFAPTSAAAL